MCASSSVLTVVDVRYSKLSQLLGRFGLSLRLLEDGLQERDVDAEVERLGVVALRRGAVVLGLVDRHRLRAVAAPAVVQPAPLEPPGEGAARPGKFSSRCCMLGLSRRLAGLARPASGARHRE